jgi:hypothetical protein
MFFVHADSQHDFPCLLIDIDKDRHARDLFSPDRRCAILGLFWQRKEGWMNGSQGRRRSIVVGALLLLAALLASAMVYDRQANANVGSGATLALVAPAQARAGSLITVDLLASDLQNLAGFQATVVFDPAQVRLVGASVADDLKRSGRDILQLGPTERPGAVTLGAVSCPVRRCSDPHPAQAARLMRGLDGRATLGTVRLYIAAPGQYTLALNELRLVDPQGRFLPVTAAPLTLNVTAR